MDKQCDKDCAMNMLQFTIDLIREHRRKCRLDPVWFPDEEWIVDAYNYIITGLECYTDADRVCCGGRGWE